jgi:hypothetical protein
MIGLAAGAATEWSVLHLSFNLLPLSNTAAPWVLIAFALALTGRRTDECLALAVVTLIALVLGFYIAEALRGWAVSRHQVAFWSLSAVVVGPLIGFAAGWMRNGGFRAAALGAGVLGGLLVGESVHGFISLRYASAPGYWDVQLGLGLALALVLALWRAPASWLARAQALAGSSAGCVIVGLGTLVAYQIP